MIANTLRSFNIKTGNIILLLRLVMASTGNDLYLKIETRPGQRECSEVEVVADGSNLLNQFCDHVK